MSSISPASATTSYALTASQPALVSGIDASDTLIGSETNQDLSGQNVDAVSKDFEAVFLSQMMSAMFSGDEFTAFFGGGTAGDIYKSMLLNEYGKSFAQAGGIGIAGMVKKELLKMQEVAA
jgi:Rod binding domain-containing protein